MIVVLLLTLVIVAHSSQPTFCINKTVEEVKNHIIKLQEKIELGKKENVCKFVGYKKKSIDKRKCDYSWYPNVLGNASWYPESVNKPINYTSMRQTTQDAYYLGVGPFIEFYGNMYLDFYVYETFFHQGDNVLINGTYLETGGADGIIASNTLFFDRFLNWKGILVEPTICAKYQIPYNRPRATTFQGGICETEATLDVSDMEVFCPDDGGFGGWKDPVRCAPLGAYLTEAIPSVGKTIDFMSIDIESHYIKGLKSIPFDVFNIRVILVECTHGVHVCVEYLSSKGYNTVSVRSIVRNDDDDVLAWKNDC